MSTYFKKSDFKVFEKTSQNINTVLTSLNGVLSETVQLKFTVFKAILDSLVSKENKSGTKKIQIEDWSNDLNYVGGQLSSFIEQQKHLFKAFLFEELQKSLKECENTLKSFNEKKNSLDEKIYDKIDKLSKKHDLTTYWSIGEYYPWTKLKESFNLKEVVYNTGRKTHKIKVNEDDFKTKTYLDVWIVLDKLIRQSGDLHHVFIENLVKAKTKDKEDGVMELVTGS